MVWLCLIRALKSTEARKELLSAEIAGTNGPQKSTLIYLSLLILLSCKRLNAVFE